jgi:hypothetical protein
LGRESDHFKPILAVPDIDLKEDERRRKAAQKLLRSLLINMFTSLRGMKSLLSLPEAFAGQAEEEQTCDVESGVDQA